MGTDQYMDSPPTVSVIIPTVGRASLAKAVQSALSQELSDGWVEVIVVNDTGCPLDPAFGDLLANPKVTVITTNRRRQAVARNVGAAVARSQLYLFLDDDDWLLHGGLTALAALLPAAGGAVLSYGSSIVIGASEDGGDVELGVLNASVAGNCAAPMLAGAFLQPGSWMCRAEAFASVGGFDATLGHSEDIHMTRMMALQGPFAQTSQVVSVYYRGGGWASTTDYAASVEALRESRERFLDRPRAFRALAMSASDAYWKARNVKAFASSIFWNVRHGRPLRALSRCLYCVGALALSLRGVFETGFWQGINDTQVPESMQGFLDRGRQASDKVSRHRE